MSDYLKEGFIDEVKGALKGEGGSGQDNVIEKIKVNGVEQAVDPNKAVDIPVPTKTSELENDEGFLTEHQDLSDYAKKVDVPTVPTNVSEFTNDSDYQTADDVSNALEPYAKSSDVTTQITEGIAKVVADAPEDFDTLKEMSDWIAGHENDASAMNSAIQDNKNGISELNANIAAHTGDKNNPHGVTKSDVGLGSVGNFKAVSTVANQGLSDTEKQNARTNIGAGTSSLTLGETSSTAYRGDKGKTAYEHSQKTSGNPHGVTKSDVGLGKVDNTADLDKPISTATQTALDDINRNLDELGKCKNFFKPTLGTTTSNGVTCTDNNDGTYTLNGTSSGINVFDFYSDNNNVPFQKGKTYKFIFLDNVPQYTALQVYVDKGNGWEIIISATSGSFNLNVLGEYKGILIRYLVNAANVTFDNFIVKPMVTTNLNATYDDFVPYTGDGDTLMADVADGMKELHDSLGDYGLDNVFDGEFVNGYINPDGTITTAPDTRTSKNSIQCSANDLITVVLDKNVYSADIFAYNSSNTVVGNIHVTNTNKCEYTAPSDTSYIKFDFGYSKAPDSVTARVYINNQIAEIKKDLGNYAPKANPTFTGTVKVGSKGIVAVNADDEQIALELQGVTIGTDGDYLDAFELREQGEPLSVLYMAKSTGADYAEYFEWADKNPNDEDRVGYFVTFDENDPEKIRYANEGDYVLGIVSGTPNVIGNDDNGWSNRYILDEFGRRIEEEFEFEETVIDEETGEKTTVTKTGTKWEENPDYDESKPYVPRKERPEWSAIGMLGVLSVYDDGTCQVNGYCKCSDNGVATSSEDGYRIIARVSDNIIKIVFR